MYEPKSTRASSLTQVAGVIATGLMTAAAGYVFSTRLADDVIGPIAGMTPTIELLARKEPPPQAGPEPKFDTTPIDHAAPAPEPPEDVDFEYDEPVVSPAAARNGPPGAGGPGEPSAHAVMRLAPKLRSTQKPPYPSREQRAGHEGMTRLEVCLDARGRVSKARLSSSSGFAGLDDAALDWVSGARFAPGALDGVRQTMCAHMVEHLWTLKNART